MKLKAFFSFVLGLSVVGGFLIWIGTPLPEKSILAARSQLRHALPAGTRLQSLPTSAGNAEATKHKVLAAYGKLPLSFEANLGQAGSEVGFLARGGGYNIFFNGRGELCLTSRNSDAPTMGSRARAPLFSAGAKHSRSRTPTPAVSHDMVRLLLAGGNQSPRAAGIEQRPGKSNYFLGKDPSQWRTNIPTYAKVKFQGVYPGVDLVYYGNQEQLEYDFIVSPGADPRVITFAVQGAGSFRIDARGDIVLGASGREFRLRKPEAYQEVGSAKQAIAGRYVLKGTDQLGFELAPYDASRPLVIDPVLVYSTYLGGSANEEARSIAVDASGNAYVTGSTDSINFPTSTGALRTTLNGISDAFVTKLDPSGTTLVYSTYLGGSMDDSATSLAIDPSGNAYVTGNTGSFDFPTTVGAFQTVFGGGTEDAFVAKLNPAGTALVYSTYLGGNDDDVGKSLAVDASGSAYLTGTTASMNFPTTPGVLQTALVGGADTFVTKLNAAGTALTYSTYFGSGQDDGNTIAVDASGNAYVAGSTGGGLPTTTGAFQTVFGGADDAFVTKFNPTGTGLVYSTFLGGTMEESAIGIAVDSSGNAYVTGETDSPDFPTTTGALRTTLSGTDDVFVTKLNAAGTALVYSTYLGGSDGEGGVGIAVDAAGNAYVTGDTSSTDFPVTPCSTQTVSGNPPLSGFDDAFVTKLDPTGSSLLYSSYLGGDMGEDGNGIAVDSAGNIYVTGETDSTNFPTAGTPFQAVNAGMGDVFITKIDPRAAPVVTLAPTSLTFSNQVVGFPGPSQPITLTNTGGLPLTTITIAATGDFAQTNNCTTPLAAGASCTINVTFTPTAIGSRTGTITVTSNGCGSPRMAALSGTGVAPIMTLTLVPNSLTFTPQNIGSTSPAQTVTLTNTGNVAVTITSIAASGDYAQTNTCGTSVAVGANCTISVTFTPTMTGTRAGAITFTDNATGSPQMAGLTGTGIDFTSSAGPATVSIPLGQTTANYTITLTPGAGGFPAAVTLAASGLPSGASANFVPPSVTPGNSAATSMMTITIMLRSQMLLGPPAGREPRYFYLFCCGALALGLLFLMRPGRRAWSMQRYAAPALLLALLLLSVAFVSGCSGRFPLGRSSPTGTPAGTYPITVTGTSGTLVRSTTVSLTVP